MPRRDESADTGKQKRPAGAIEKGQAGKKGAGRPAARTRAWPAVNKLGDAGRSGSRRKIPSGPVGGSGRKTNLARSS